MRFNFYKRPERPNQNEWHPWFAWYPVSIDGNEVRWLERVERRIERWIEPFQWEWADPPYPVYEYRARRQ